MLVDRAAPSTLFSPIRIAGHTVRNRIVLPSMHTGFANPDGTVSPRMLAFLEPRAAGIGILTVEHATVHPSGRRISTDQLVIWDDDCVPGLRQAADLAHRQGALAVVQLSHAGRQTTAQVVGARPVAPSAVTCTAFPDPPRELEAHEIPAFQAMFVEAAERAARAGLDGVELHAGHGFLLNQFLSPHYNRRQDGYGGDTGRRARFVTEIIREIRGRLGPHFMIILRMSVVEGVEGGLEVPESRRLALLFQEAGIDLLHCSIGVAFNRYLYCPPMAMGHACLLPLAAAIKEVVKVPVIAVGRLHDPRLAEAALREGKADMVAMGRGLIADPSLPQKAARGDLDGIRLCVGCNQACRARPLTCTINAQAGNERERPVAPASHPRRVLVLGGGPAGLEAARTAASRGHRVVLLESADRLGGQMVVGSIPPTKGELMVWVRYAEGELRRMGVEIRLGERATAATLSDLSPDCVVVATGGVPLRPPIPGLGSEQVVSAVDALSGRADVGRQVVVIGGGETGCETADHLASEGRQVTIVEMLPAIAREVAFEPRHYLLQRLSAGNVQLLTSTRVAGVGAGWVEVDAPTGRSRLGADTVVLAVGSAPNPWPAEELSGMAPEIHVIGDAASPGDLVKAIHSGFLVGAAI